MPAVQAPVGVYAQAVSSAHGKVLVLINKKSRSIDVDIAGGAGNVAYVLDDSTVNRAAAPIVLASDAVTLSRFAVMFVTFNATM